MVTISRSLKAVFEIYSVRARAAKRLSTACCVWCRSTDKPARHETSPQTIKAVLGKNRIAAPYRLRLVAGECSSQHTDIERREEGGDRRGNLLGRLSIDPVEGPLDRPDHLQ